MKNCYIATVALNLTPLCNEENKKKIIQAIEYVKQQAADFRILCLPQLVLTSVGCQDMFLASQVEENALHLLRELLPLTEGLLVNLGLPLTIDGVRTRATAFVADQKILAIHYDRLLDNEGIGYDSRWFTSKQINGDPLPSIILGGIVPCGVDHVQWKSLRIGILETPLAAEEFKASSPMDIIFCLGAVPFETGLREYVVESLLSLSHEQNNIVVFSNYLGNESGELLYDGGSLIAQQGNLVAQCPRFSYRDLEMVGILFDATEDGIIPTQEIAQLEPWEESADLWTEELARAVPLAMFDYMRKSHSNGFVLSLSGGADSTAVAVFVRLMVHFGWKESAFWEKMAYIPALKGLIPPIETNEEKVVARLLTTVYQSTRHSGQLTREAAQAIAQFVGSTHHEFNIDPLVEAYQSMIETAIGRELTWEQDDIPLQNIQARTRGPGAWLLANLQQAILLTTGNRSEAGCGYMTMDGDTCGGLAPLMGLDKATLRMWLRWFEKTGPETFGPSPILKLVNDQQPTAELRPAAKGQTDESDLMPYPILDLFEGAVIGLKICGEQAIDYVRQMAQLQQLFYEEELLKKWYLQYCSLWTRSQWKRHRSAPGFHLDSRDLSPNSWCRFPILSGSLEE